MNNVDKEIMQHLYRKILEQLESCSKLDDFMGLIEKVLVEAIINFSDGDMKLAAKILKISEKSLEKKIIRDFGTKDLMDFHVLLRRMRDRKKVFEIE